MASDVLASVLAHQGGWDEILFVLVPLAVLAALLLSARRRLDDPEDPPDDDPARAPSDAASPESSGTG